jgi:hypothetical protein
MCLPGDQSLLLCTIVLQLLSSVKKQIAKINQEQQEEKFTRIFHTVYMWSNKRIAKCNEKKFRNKKLQPFCIFKFYYGNTAQRKCCKKTV